MHACCIDRCLSGTGHAWENVHVMKGMSPYSAAASSEWGSTEEGSGGLDGMSGGGPGGGEMGMGSPWPRWEEAVEKEQ